MLHFARAPMRKCEQRMCDYDERQCVNAKSNRNTSSMQQNCATKQACRSVTLVGIFVALVRCFVALSLHINKLSLVDAMGMAHISY